MNETAQLRERWWRPWTWRQSIWLNFLHCKPTEVELKFI